MKSLKPKKFAALVLALLLIACFGLLLFHHHDAQENGKDCPACQLLHQVSINSGNLPAFFFSLLFVFSFPLLESVILHFFLISSLKSRAPPFSF